MRHCPAERPTQGEWKVITWAEYLLAARQIAGGLADLGVGAGERVGDLVGQPGGMAPRGPWDPSQRERDGARLPD